MRIIHKCFVNSYKPISEVNNDLRKKMKIISSRNTSWVIRFRINLHFPGDYDYSCGKFPEAYASMILFSFLPVSNSRDAEALSIK